MGGGGVVLDFYRGGGVGLDFYSGGGGSAGLL